MSKVTVNYKVEGTIWENAIDKAFEKLNQKVKIDGFRQGKAPRNIFEKKYGKQELMIEASDDLIHHQFHHIIEEKNIEPITEPKVDIVKMDENGLEVNYTFIVDPEVKLGKYKNLGVKKEKVTVTKEEIENGIDRLLKEYTEMISVDRKVVSGDTAIIDFEGFKDNIPFDGGKGENYSLEIGSNTFIPGFEDQIIGMDKNEEKSINVTFPENYQKEDLQGKEVTFKVKVNDIKEKVTPQLNKEFFEDLQMDGVDSKEKLESMIEKEIEAQKNADADNKFIDELLRKASQNIEAEIEDEIYETEVNRMYNDFMERMKMQGISEDLYFQYTNTTSEDLKKNMKSEAENRVKSRYLLMGIAKEENINPTEEEVQNELKDMIEKYHTTEKEILEAFGSLDTLKFDLQMRKAINFLKDNN